MSEWTNEKAIAQWGTMPVSALAATTEDGDFAKRHLINPVVLEMLGDVRGRRVLDAGCGNGYLSRMLADRGALVTGVEPGQSLFSFAASREASSPRGIRYVQTDICKISDLGDFDSVVASMVLPVIPAWTDAMRACVSVLRPGGLFVFTVNHPCFEGLWPTWRANGGAYRIERYLERYEIPGPRGTDFHRTIGDYLNALAGLGCRLISIAEPGLDPALVTDGPEGIDAYVRLPNFLIVAASTT